MEHELEGMGSGTSLVIEVLENNSSITYMGLNSNNEYQLINIPLVNNLFGNLTLFKGLIVGSLSVVDYQKTNISRRYYNGQDTINNGKSIFIKDN